MTTHTYDDADDPQGAPDTQPPRKKKRRKRNGFLKTMAVGAAGAVTGALAIRAFDKHVLGKKTDQDNAAAATAAPAVQSNPMPAFGMMPMLPMFQPFAPQPTYPAQPRANPAPPIDDDPDPASDIVEEWEQEGWD